MPWFLGKWSPPLQKEKRAKANTRTESFVCRHFRVNDCIDRGKDAAARKYIITWISIHLPLVRAEAQAAIAKAYIWCGPDKIDPFCERFREVRFVEDGDPARALCLTGQKAKINRINQATDTYKKVHPGFVCVMVFNGMKVESFQRMLGGIQSRARKL